MNDPVHLPPVNTAHPEAGQADLSTRVGPFEPSNATRVGGELHGEIAGYRLLGEIGRGGMGVVYRAHDLALNRNVAVKILQERFHPSAAAACRFVEEAQITAQLQHPGIPPVHQVGTLPDGRPFLAMKLIKGRTLADLLADANWDHGHAIGTFEQICHAVAYAHDHGVIHRDLKPENVMVGRFNEVQVMDWGLAKYRTAARDKPNGTTATSTFHDPRAAESDDFETGAGSILGTPAYMPPEQAIGAVGQVDERSDVFGLGAILCAVLTGRPPYVGADSESTRQLAARAKQDDAHARLAGCKADPELVALCRRCLSPEPADRPANAGEVARAVAGLRAAADERARRADLDRVRAEGERAKAEAEAREQRKRRLVQMALAITVGLLLTGGGAFAWHADIKEHEARAQRDRNVEALADLLTRCETAMRENDGDWAVSLMEEVDRRQAEPGGEALSGRAAGCRRDLALLRELDAVDTFRWTPVDNQLPDGRTAVERWRAALARYGFEATEWAAETSAEAVNGSLIRDRLLAVLDLWLVNAPSAGVRALLRRADPDTYREAVRDAIVAADGARQAVLVGGAAPEQPPRFVGALAQLKAVPVDCRRSLLEAAVRQRPGDFAVLMTMGQSFPIGRREGAAERLRWYQGAVAARPRSSVAHVALGIALVDGKDLPGAAAAFREAVRLDHTYVLAHLNLGSALAEQGDLPAALAAFGEAIRLDPRYAAHSHYARGIVLLNHRGDVWGAVAAYREAIRLDPEFVQAHDNLATILTAVGDLPGAITCFRQVVRLDPQNARAYSALGSALAARGDPTEAVVALMEAVRLNPKDPKARNLLGWLLAAGPAHIRDGQQAVEHASQACELTGWNNPTHLDTLAAALAAAGDFDRAVEYQNKALSFPGFMESDGKEGRQRLALYRQKKAYYDPAFFSPEPGPPPRVVGAPTGLTPK